MLQQHQSDADKLSQYPAQPPQLQQQHLSGSSTSNNSTATVTSTSSHSSTQSNSDLPPAGVTTATATTVQQQQLPQEGGLSGHYQRQQPLQPVPRHHRRPPQLQLQPLQPFQVQRKPVQQQAQQQAQQQQQTPQSHLQQREQSEQQQLQQAEGVAQLLQQQSQQLQHSMDDADFDRQRARTFVKRNSITASQDEGKLSLALFLMLSSSVCILIAQCLCIAEEMYQCFLRTLMCFSTQLICAVIASVCYLCHTD
jgi:hypothetical protein